jgi:hypothetical protein
VQIHSRELLAQVGLVLLEKKTIREYVKTRGEHVIEPTIDTTLDSLGEAYYFYNMYSWEH